MFGDNGIIANAQRANILQSCASLEDFFNEYYVEHYEDFADSTDVILEIEKDSVAQKWFHIPKNDGIGNLNYVVDNEGNSLFLIKKSGLPDNIQKNVVGGEAGDGSYASYSSLIDVYGITNNLKVYYCMNDKEFIGLASKNELDKDNPLREVFSSTSNSVIYELLKSYDKKDADGNTDGILTAEEMKLVTEVSLTSTTNTRNLKDLALLPNLTELILNNIPLDSLDGLENLLKLNKITIRNYENDSDKIKDYSKLKLATKLKTLIISNSCDAQLDNVCSAMAGVEFPLVELQISDSANVTDISPLLNLSRNTQKNVSKLYLANTNIASLESLTGFSGVTSLQVPYSLIKTLKGVENMTRLTLLYAFSCKLGDDEVYDTALPDNGMDANSDALSPLSRLTSLESLNIQDNTNLKWLSYINTNTHLFSLVCSNNTNMVKSDVAKIKNIFSGLSSDSRSTGIPSKYLSLFNSEETVDYLGYEINLTNDSDEILALLDNTDVQYLRLDGNSNLGNGIAGTSYDLSDILATCTSVRSLSLRGLPLLDNLDFVSSMPDLTVLDIFNCPNITDLSILDTQTNAGHLHLYTLRINNSNADLTTCQKTISGLQTSGDLAEKNMFGSSGQECRGFCANAAVYNNLNLCTDVTALRLHYRMDLGNPVITLTGCSSLTELYSSHCAITFVLPSEVESLYLAHYSARRTSDLSRCTNLKKIRLIEVFNSYPFDEWLEEIGNCTNVEEVQITTYECNKTLDFNNLANCSKLTTFRFTRYNGTYARGTSIIENLDKAEQLTSIYFAGIVISNSDFTLPKSCVSASFINCKLEDVPKIDPTATALKTLNLYDCKVASLQRLEGVYCIEDLNLEGNLLEDTYTYIDENGNVKSQSTCQTIFDLKNNGSLKKIAIKNENMTDYSLLNISGWDDKNKKGW